MSLRLKLERSAIKLRVAPHIPAQIVGTGGISVTRANGTYTIAPDAGLLGDVVVSGAPTLGQIAFFLDDHTIAGGALNNVDNTSDATKNAAVATLTNKTINGANNTLTVLAGSQLSGQVPLANGGTGANLTDPNADRIMFWDDSAGSTAFLTAGAGLAISGTSITASSSFVDVVTSYSVDNTGVSNTASTFQTAITAIAAAGYVIYIPAGIYNLGSSTLTFPDYAVVLASPNAILRRTVDLSGAAPYSDYTKSMIVIGNYCRWNGGVLDNTAVLATSTSSVTIGAVGTKTFTVAAGLGLTTSTFLRMQSRANAANHMEGTVSSYSGTTLVVGGLFASGSGTFTDWDIMHGSVYQSPMVLHGVTNSIVENARVTGQWYVGITMDGWNLTPSTTLTVNKCVIRNCRAENVHNRGFYIYGNSADCSFENCIVSGNSGVTDYGFNLNPANATGNVNGQIRTKLIGCSVIGTSGQGITFADLCSYCVAESCFVHAMTNSGAVAFYAVKANGQIPQYNRFNNCIASFCASGFYFAGSTFNNASGCSAVVCGTGFAIQPSAGSESQYINISGCEAHASTAAGFLVAGNSVRCNLTGIMAISNATNGVQIDTGAAATLVTGRAFNNTTNNLLDNGTATVKTDLTVA